MKFVKDILLFDIETTGQNPEKDHIIQLAAILIDKDNLLEKQRFNRYIKVSFLDATIIKHSEMLGITFDRLRESKKIYDVIKLFDATFGSNPLLAGHNIVNTLFLRTAYKKATLPFQFGSHSIDIWTLGYLYTLRYGIRKMPSMNTLYDSFGLKLTRQRDAAARTSLTAEVFRRMVQDI